ncbi:MAG: membrane protein insertase YidC [Alphaproteobacteria bacterium]|nr:membrane protein insertase YidC [Alphaproteobacteria bacterium]
MIQYMNNNSGFANWAKMQQEKKSPKKKMGFFWWLFLFLFAWWVFSGWFQTKNQQPVVDNTVAIESVKNVKTNILESDKIATSVQGLRLSNISLKDYKQSSKTDDKIVLLSKENNFIEIGFVSSDTQTPNINTSWNIKNNNMVWNNGKVKFVRDIYVKDYVITITDTIINNTGKDINISPYTKVVQNSSGTVAGAVETGGVVYANSKLDYTNWNKLDKKSVAYSSVNASVGFAEQYWETIASIDSPDQTISIKKNGDLYVADTNVANVKVKANDKTTINTYIFAGPRIGQILADSATNIPGLHKTIDYGWFWFFAQPMLWTINKLNGFVGNYGLAIIIMTLILRLLIWPLTRKSYTSTMAMQKMQPELQRVQKLYANDKARLQMEMMKIYQTHKTSPMSGCLPMLIQIPIFFALYKALLIAVPMRNAGFLWVSDLAVMDPYFILPILMGATMWFQQKFQTAKTNTANKNDAMASTQRAMKWMPLIFTIMFAWMPAGLVLY